MKSEAAPSPILAAHNPTLYWIIVAAISTVLLILLVSFVSKKAAVWIKKSKSAKSGKKLTTKKDINYIYRKASLTENQTKMLWHICRKFSVPDIISLNSDAEAIDELLKKQYVEMKAKNAREEQFTTLYHLNYKLEAYREQDYVISLSSSLKPGEEVTFKDSNGINWIFYLVKNGPQEMLIEITKAFYNSSIKPAPLTKFILTVSGTSNTAYTMQARVIRYEEAMDGKYMLAVKPSKSLIPIQRRRYKRMEINVPCIFTEVEPRSSGAGNSRGYAVLSGNMNGTLGDISASGCSLSGSQDIMTGHYLNVKFQMDGQEMEAVGIILSTTQNSEGEESLYHIKFTDIDVHVKNSIYAHVYGWTSLFPPERSFKEEK